MKRTIAVILALLMVLSLTACGCRHVYGEWTETKKATSFDYGERVRRCKKCGAVDKEMLMMTNKDHGDKLPLGTVREVAEKYVKEHMVGGETSDGVEITKVTIGSSNYHFYETPYCEIVVNGTYKYNGKDKYGRNQSGEQTFSISVLVYEYEYNPDHYTKVMYK